MSDRSTKQIFPETEIVDAWALLQELGLSSLEVYNGERVVGMVTPAEIEQHRAGGERTCLVGSIMTLPPEIVRAPRARYAGSVRGDDPRPTVGADRQIAPPVRDWLDAPSHPAPSAIVFASRAAPAEADELRDPLLAIEVHEAARAFRLWTRLKELDPELVPGDGDTWHVRLSSRQNGMEVHEALTLVREWLVEEELSAAIVRIGGARQLVTPDS
jgi:hypothetical protein